MRSARGERHRGLGGGSGPGCRPGITRIDPATNAVTDPLNAGGQTNPLALHNDTLWYGTHTSNFLGRVDTNTDSVVGQLKLPGEPFGMTTGFGYVWATDTDDGLLIKIDPS